MVRYGFASQHPTTSFIDVHLLNLSHVGDLTSKEEFQRREKDQEKSKLLPRLSKSFDQLNYFFTQLIEENSPS